MPRLDESHKQAKTGRDSSRHIVSKRLFPLQIDPEVRLNLLGPRHAVELFMLVDSNRTHLREWLPFIDDYHSVTAAIQFITRNREENSGTTRLAIGIEVGEMLAGVVTYDYIDWGNRAALMGFWLGKSFQGRGIMTRACSVLVDLAFNDLGLNRVEISCALENKRCRLVPERLGFRQEGISRQSEWLYDHFVDTVSYSLLASDWRNRTV
ncbi:MAG TPA: GNAT family protein [Candidatus Angelobacter sp.]|nr:GNAT family protein [Candidatus Angelobacter sp.]